MRTSWNGSLTFGLVSIPVGLAPATKPAARQSDVSFRLLHRECLTPIKQKRWCPKHDRELAPDEIVKGWEAAKGQFVIVEEAELEALEAHDDSRSIEISQFVPVEDVDPIWRDRTYFLVPGTTAAQRRPYRLLLEPLLDYIRHVADQRQPNEVITIVVPQFVPRHAWHNVLHAQTAVMLRMALMFRPGIVITSVPYLVGLTEEDDASSVE